MLGGSDDTGSEQSSDQTTLGERMKEKLRTGLQSVSDVINKLSNTTSGVIPSVNPSELMSAISNLIQTACSAGMNCLDHQGHPLTYEAYYLSQPPDVFMKVGNLLERDKGSWDNASYEEMEEALGGLTRTLTQNRDASNMDEMMRYRAKQTGAGKYPVSEKRKKAKKRTKKLARKKKTKKR